MSSKDEEFSNGPMEKFMKGSGSEVQKMEAECGRESMASPILESGRMARSKALECSLCKMVLAMKENSEIH